MTAAVDAAVLTSNELLAVIRHQADHAPRSLQKHIGPSGVGTPCDRRLALELLGATVHKGGTDKWAATVGTAVHAWLADAFTADNNRLASEGRPPRWLVEQRVTVRTGLAGSCDLYDLQTHTVTDWKTTSVTRLREYRAKGDPGQQYRYQAHLYGMGWANAGLPVRDVAVVFLPRSGVLRDTYYWTEPYDPAVAQAALDRMDGLLVGADIAETLGGLGEFMQLLPRDTAFCDYCPFYRTDRAGDPADGCAGPLEDLAPGEQPQVQALAGIF